MTKTIQKILFTFLIFFLIRLGSHIPLPEFNSATSQIYYYTHVNKVVASVTSFFLFDNGIISIFYLSIIPYITATIIVQILSNLIPKLKKYKKEGELEGRRYIVQLTRYITLFVSLAQSYNLISGYDKRVFNDISFEVVTIDTIFYLTTGSMIMLWLSELIDEYGLGTGSAVILLTNIVGNIPDVINKIVKDLSTFGFNSNLSTVLLITTPIIVVGILYILKCKRKIKLVSIKQLTNYKEFSQTQSSKKFIKEDGSAENNYIPFPYSQAGVFPIIIASSLITLISNNITLNNITFLKDYFNPELPYYWFIYVTIILISTSNYSNIVAKPKDVSEQLQKMAVVVENTKPGRQTTFFINEIQSRITNIGAISLAFLVLVPNYLELKLTLSRYSSFSLTSLVVMAGIILELVRGVRNKLML